MHKFINQSLGNTRRKKTLDHSTRTKINMLLALNWFLNFFSVPDKKYVFRFKVRQENLDPFEVVFQNVEEKKPLLHFGTQIPKPVKNQKLILTRHRNVSRRGAQLMVNTYLFTLHKLIFYVWKLTWHLVNHQTGFRKNNNLVWLDSYRPFVLYFEFSVK